jgi:hypothetical protein
MLCCLQVSKRMWELLQEELRVRHGNLRFISSVPPGANRQLSEAQDEWAAAATGLSRLVENSLQVSLRLVRLETHITMTFCCVSSSTLFVSLSQVAAN